MGVSAGGHIHHHLSAPCPRCGYATRFKQWPNRCACSRAEGRKLSAASAPRHVVETQAGQQAASRANGTKFGRPKKVKDGSHIGNARRMKVDGHSARDIAKYLGVSRATLYRYLGADNVA